MARCASDNCNTWRPELIARRIAGVTIDGRWFCSQDCVERMARRLLASAKSRTSGIAPVPPLKIGVLLRHQGVVTSEQLERALAEQRKTRMRLGAQLQALGLATDAAVLRALAEQAGVPCILAIDPSSVEDAPAGLPRDAVRALGLVPIGEPDKTGHIRVACQAPVPRAALGALHRLTGWTPKPFLVTDATFAALVDAFGTRQPEQRGAQEFVRASSLTDAAARIAAAAATARATKVTDAHWEPYTWVRVQTPGLVRDVLLQTGEEPRWPAANTSH